MEHFPHSTGSPSTYHLRIWLPIGILIYTMAGSPEATFSKETLLKIRLVMEMGKAEKLSEPENDGDKVYLPCLWTTH